MIDRRAINGVARVAVIPRYVTRIYKESAKLFSGIIIVSTIVILG